MPLEHRISFHRDGEDLGISIDSSNEDSVAVMASLSSLRSAFPSDASARNLPVRLESAAAAARNGIEFLDKMAEKLAKQGYSISMENGKPKLGEGEDHQLDLYFNIDTGQGKKTDGLEASISRAYEEVLRENKSLAAYMSKGQSAQRGA